MSNVALCDAQLVAHQAGYEVPIAVVADDEVWVLAMPSIAQLFLHCLGGLCCEALQVRPDFKPAPQGSL